MIVSDAHADHINFNDEDYSTTDVFWNEEVDGDHYTENGVVDNNCDKTKERNDTIEQIRDKYSAEKKIGLDYYEKHSQRTYKSLEDYKEFFKEVEDKELCIKAEPRTPFQDKLDILYYGPNEKRGRDPVTRKDPDIYYSFKALNRCQKEEQEDKL
jgi:hypothetical protein